MNTVSPARMSPMRLMPTQAVNPVWPRMPSHAPAGATSMSCVVVDAGVDDGVLAPTGAMSDDRTHGNVA